MNTVYLKKNAGSAVRDRDGNLTISEVSSNTIVYCTGIAPVNVSVVPYGGGNSYIQTSVSNNNLIDGGKGVWEDWEKGSVSSKTDDVLLYPVNAMKVVVVNGYCNVYMVANSLK